MTQATVMQIGKNAIDPQERMLILFGDQATTELKKVSIIQDIAAGQPAIELKPTGTISFDDQDYTITYVGPLATEQLNAIGHVTVVFQEAPIDNGLANSVYVQPFTIPKISEGSIITYH